MNCFFPLSRHLEIFELVYVEDERELAARLEAVSVDLWQSFVVKLQYGCGLPILMFAYSHLALNFCNFPAVFL